MTFIRVRDLCKDFRISSRSRGLLGLMLNAVVPRYTVKHAVKDVSFDIGQGDMVGFIGPNGAGKSTTVKMLSGILHPSRGEITVDGLVPHKNRTRHVKRIGVVFGQKSQLWWDLPVSESYDMLKYIYRIDSATYAKNLGKVKEMLGLGEYFNQPVRQLSLGQRMKADLGAAFLHSPDILFLDEPTIGLDVVAKENIRVFLREINKENNVTMLFTTHDMQDIEKTCGRMIIIDKGQKLYDGSIEEIRTLYAKDRELTVKFAEDCRRLEIEGTTVLHESDRVKRIKFRNCEIPVQNLIARISRSHAIADLSLKETEIESIIREIYINGMASDASVL